MTGQDPNHCGNCNTVCGTTEICVAGGCQCPGSNSDADAGPITNYLSCAGQCVDLLSSSTHCGDCFNVCEPEQRCRQGVCGCAATDILCNGSTACAKTDVNCAANGACFDPLTSNDHCGDCATQCAQYQQCVQGQCVLNCAQNNLTQCGGTCIDTQNDPANNAANGNVALNCGACGQACPSDKFMCSQGSCVCKNPLGTRCGDKCVDLQTNPAFCGACNNPCATGYDCVNGVCVCAATFNSVRRWLLRHHLRCEPLRRLHNGLREFTGLYGRQVCLKRRLDRRT